MYKLIIIFIWFFLWFSPAFVMYQFLHTDFVAGIWILMGWLPAGIAVIYLDDDIGKSLETK